MLLYANDQLEVHCFMLISGSVTAWSNYLYLTLDITHKDGVSNFK